MSWEALQEGKAGLGLLGGKKKRMQDENYKTKNIGIIYEIVDKRNE